MAGVYFNGARVVAGVSGVYFSGARFNIATSGAWFYDGHWYWLGADVERTAICGWPYGDWTDGVYHIEAEFCGWYTRGVSFTYMGDCDLRTLVGGAYPSAWLDRSVNAFVDSPTWARVGAVLDQTTGNAVGQHFWGIDAAVGGVADRGIGDDVVVGGWYQWAGAGIVTFEIIAMYRADVEPGGGTGVLFNAVRFANA